MAKKELLIIIPAYNEEKNIGALLDQLDQPWIARIADVLVMNDHSSDKTNLLVKNHHHELVTHVYNLGYGGGLRLGYKYAVRRGYRYVIQMDADGQHDVCNIPNIYRALKTPDEEGNFPDIVLGSRFLDGSKSFPVSKLKMLAIRLFRRMIRHGTGQTILDPTSGLQGLSRRAFLFYSKYNQFDDSYPDANMIIQMLLLGFHVTEIPAVMHERNAGSSMHAGLEPVAYMIRMFFSILAVEFRIRVLKWKVEGIEDYEMVFPETQLDF
jgi:glycosyltransferase involved in cell wall biosynthesis